MTSIEFLWHPKRTTFEITLLNVWVEQTREDKSVDNLSLEVEVISLTNQRDVVSGNVVSYKNVSLKKLLDTSIKVVVRHIPNKSI
jgi:hypothetical protein